jgi:4-alpha-glucanotransferase
MSGDELYERATELGVEVQHHDINGAHTASPEMLERVVAMLEDDLAGAPVSAARAISLEPVYVQPRDITVRGPVAEASLLVHGSSLDIAARTTDEGVAFILPADLPVGCHVLEVTTDAGPAESLVVIAPEHMWRSPAFSRATSLFAPTYALWEADDPLPSFDHLRGLAAVLPAMGVDVVATLPLYATFLDEPYDPSPYSPISRLHWNEVYLSDASLPPAPLPHLGEAVDWRSLGERRRHQLIEAAAGSDGDLDRRLDAFAAAHPDVGAYARFRAQRDPPRAGQDVTARSHVLAQMLAHEQLGAVQSAEPGRRSAALALDLPVGSHPAGYETWAYPSLFAHGMSVGAPPDALFAGGQNWGFPPPLPSAMRQSAYLLWRKMIERAGMFADVLRIDHIMAVQRLWWVPEGGGADQGVYVRYHRDELLAVIAATAAAAGVTIVGEDLGTVSPEVREALHTWDVIGMHEEQFHVHDHDLPIIPRRSVAGIRTHDMPAFASFASENDLSGYRHRVAAQLEHEVATTDAALLDAVYERLARSDAYLVSADLDDLTGETRPHNLPGRVVDGNWSRRLSSPTSALLTDPEVRHRLSLLERTSS